MSVGRIAAAALAAVMVGALPIAAGAQTPGSTGGSAGKSANAPPAACPHCAAQGQANKPACPNCAVQGQAAKPGCPNCPAQGQPGACPHCQHHGQHGQQGAAMPNCPGMKPGPKQGATGSAPSGSQMGSTATPPSGSQPGSMPSGSATGSAPSGSRMGSTGAPPSGSQPGSPPSGGQAQRPLGSQPQGPMADIEGYVVSVSPFLDNIRILGGEQNNMVTLEVPEDSDVTIDGRVARLDDIPEGAEVRATYRLQGNQLVAESIQASSQPKGMGEDVPPTSPGLGMPNTGEPQDDIDIDPLTEPNP